MAIALDTATNGGATVTSTTHTFSHTCTGSNLILFVHAFVNTSTDVITGATYNGSAMTLVDKQPNSTDRYEYLFYLLNPSTGANNVVISNSNASFSPGGNAISYTGAKQSSQPDASAKQTVSGSPVTTSVTTIDNNCWTILVTSSSTYVSSASTNSTLRVTNGTYGSEKIFDSNGAITPAGSFSMSLTGASGNVALIMASFSPLTATVAGRKTLLGVGI